MEVLTSTADGIAILKGDVISVMTNIGSPVRSFLGWNVQNPA
jgi:alpha-amylase